MPAAFLAYKPSTPTKPSFSVSDFDDFDVQTAFPQVGSDSVGAMPAIPSDLERASTTEEQGTARSHQRSRSWVARLGLAIERYVYRGEVDWATQHTRRREDLGSGNYSYEGLKQGGIWA